MSEKATRLPDVRDFSPRDDIAYFKDPNNGQWFLHLPGVGWCGCRIHQATEEKDGTLTLNPSFLVTGGPIRRHGWLKSGVWEPATDDQAPNSLNQNSTAERTPMVDSKFHFTDKVKVHWQDTIADGTVEAVEQNGAVDVRITTYGHPQFNKIVKFSPSDVELADETGADPASDESKQAESQPNGPSSYADLEKAVLGERFGNAEARLDSAEAKISDHESRIAKLEADAAEKSPT